MRVVIHDFAGHPGQLQLSRELARRGHDVEHQYCASVMTGRGATERNAADPPSFSIRPIELRREFARYSPAMRVCQELRYAWLTARAVRAARPDVVMFANVPTLPLLFVTVALRRRRVPYVLWWQDVFSAAVGSIARRRFGRLGGLLGWAVGRVERKVASSAVAIVPISSAFLAPLAEWGIDLSKVTVIPNWGALDEVPARPRRNPWGEAHGLTDVPVVMYAGTLGFKHDPAIIAGLAKALPSDARTVVVSQGKGREWLADRVADSPGLMLLDFQPYQELPDVLASADVLLAVLEQDASRFSVPSKVLTYLCAGRPILALLPEDNAVADVLATSGAAVVVNPGDTAGASAALHRLLDDPDSRARMGTAARRYAETAFDIDAIGTRFEEILNEAGRRHPTSNLSHQFPAIP